MRTIEWPNLADADRVELENRIRIIDWVRDVINAPAEEVGPEQLAKRAIDLFCHIDGENISYRIVKGKI